MRFIKNIAGPLLLLFIVVPPLVASNLNPGVVNLRSVRENSAEYQQKLRNFQSRKQRALKQLNQKKATLNDQINQRRGNDKNRSLDTKRKKLVLYRKLQTLKRRRERLKQLVENRKARLQEQFLKTVQETVKPLAKKRGLNVIFNQSSKKNYNKILWAASNRNITEAVLRNMD